MKKTGTFFTTSAAMLLLLCMSALPSLAGGADTQRLEDTVRMLLEQNRELMKQNRELSQRLQKVEREMDRMKEGTATEAGAGPSGGAPEGTEEEAAPWYNRISIEGGATGVLQASVNNSDNTPDTGDKTDMAYTVDLNVESDFGSYGNFHIHIEGGDGEGMNDDVPSFSVPNYDAYATWNNNNQADLTFSEAFYENSFMDDMITLDIGKMDISVLFDENEAAGDETTQFLSNIFVKSMGIVIPEAGGFYCPGVMISASPAELVEFRVIGASVDNNEEENTWENLFSNDFIAAQINFRPMLLNRQGNYRFYAWNDSRRYMKVDDLPGASNRYSEGNNALTGWGLSFNQELADGITAFARYSWKEGDLAQWNPDDSQWEVIPLNQTYSLGFNISGMLWNRGEDGIGMAFGQTLLSDDFEDVQTNSADEKYVEAYYRYVLGQHLALSADFQWIQNAGGTRDSDDVYLFGLRSQIDF